MIQAAHVTIFNTNKNGDSGPSSNTGLLKEKTQEKTLALKGDQVKLSIRQELLPEAPGGCAPYEFAFELFLAITGLLVGASGWSITGRDMKEPGQNGFERGCYLRFNGEVRASFQWGGKAQRGWCLLHINGALCAILTPRYWVKLYCLARRYKGRLGMFDLAGDDYTGLLGFSPGEIRAAHHQAPEKFLPEYRVMGIAPKFNKWIESPTGCTVYLGAEKTSIRHRIYEKGKQLNDLRRLDWVRWEVMFRRTTGKTELNLGLLYPGNWPPAWLGSCGYLADKFKINGARFIMPVDQAKRGAQEIAAKALLTLQKQWGGTIGHLERLMGAEALIDAIKRNAPSSPLAGLQPADIGPILEIRDELRSSANSEAGALAAARAQGLTYLQESILAAWKERHWNGEEDLVIIGEKSYSVLGDLAYLAGETGRATEDMRREGAAVGLDLAFTLDLLGTSMICARGTED